MARIQIKNWVEFQHYKHRCPPWVKLHRNLLDNYEFACLPVDSRALAPMLWLLASESSDGSIDHNVDMIAFRLRTTKEAITAALQPLIDAGFICVTQGDSEVLAAPKQNVTTEKSREEKSREESAHAIPARMEEKGTRVATEPVPNNSDLMVQMLVGAHPRNLSPTRSEQEAMAAIQREAKNFGGPQGAYEYLFERVKLYASITAKYSSIDKEFIPGADTWFREKRYLADEKLWLKGDTSKVPQGRNGLDILAEREAEIAR